MSPRVCRDDRVLVAIVWRVEGGHESHSAEAREPCVPLSRLWAIEDLVDLTVRRRHDGVSVSVVRCEVAPKCR